MAVSGSSSVTKAPGTAAQGSPVSNQYQPPSIWANLSNIAVADGNYAEALSNANGIYVTNITVDGVNPVSVTKYVPTNIWTNSEWMVNTLGGPTDTWGYSISVSQVNSPNFGIILYPPACPSLTLTNFGFNIPDGNAINGIEFTIKTQSIYQQDNPLGCLPSIGCGIGHWRIDAVSVTVYYSAVAAQCTPGQMYCGAGSDGMCCHKYTCNSGMWVDNGVDVSTCPPGPGSECDIGTKCVNGEYFECQNGYWKSYGMTTACPGGECAAGATKCVNGNIYGCNNGYWQDNGVSSTCPGSQCSAGYTSCQGGHRTVCSNGYLVDSGLDPSCPGTECATGQTKCVGGIKYGCQNGYWTNLGTDHSCPGPECNATGIVCQNGHQYNCDNGWLSEIGPSDCCDPASISCSNGKLYSCNQSQNWADMGYNTYCPGTACNPTDTKCDGGNKYNCVSGQWNNQGANQTCPGNECLVDGVTCESGHKIQCSNGYRTDLGVDHTCPGSECDGNGATCNGTHLISCSNGWMTDLGEDASCQNNPPPVQNDYSSLLWIAAGLIAIGGGYYLYNRQEKKSKYPKIPPKTPQKPTGYTAKKK